MHDCALLSSHNKVTSGRKKATLNNGKCGWDCGRSGPRIVPEWGCFNWAEWHGLFSSGCFAVWGSLACDGGDRCVKAGEGGVEGSVLKDGTVQRGGGSDDIMQSVARES